MRKNETLCLRCEGLGSELEGIARLEGMPVFVPGMLPGEEGEVLIVKTQPNYAFGKLLSLGKNSPERREPFCGVYAHCGGCGGQHMSYEATLEAKRSQVLECLNRIGRLNLSPEQVLPPLGAENPLHCRNKAALPIGGTWKEPRIGFYRRRSHDIIPLEECPISMQPLQPIVAAVKDWIISKRIAPYEEQTRRGTLRHLVVRSSRAGQVMVLLVATSDKLPHPEKLAQSLKAAVPGFCALHLSVNRAAGNVILGPSSQKLWGADHIEETLLGREFEIPPLSFFQVNPDQTEKLYQTALDMAALTGRETVVDAYAGAGTISLCMASSARRVLGIEIVPQAVEGAWRNAERNGVTNAEFVCAPVEDCLPRRIAEGLRPDVVVLDPPRKGAEPQVLEAILQAAPRRIVYISCHVPTQARDAAILCGGGQYRLKYAQSVDLFCYTGGIENAALFERVEVN